MCPVVPTISSVTLDTKDTHTHTHTQSSVQIRRNATHGTSCPLSHTCCIAIEEVVVVIVVATNKRMEKQLDVSIVVGPTECFPIEQTSRKRAMQQEHV